ncbi:MAG TPA: CBS domain-containing protein [Longimicrobiales bacterium]|nr:CBS domain-containing protein [Longimicrobiales bacterium]
MSVRELLRTKEPAVTVRTGTTVHHAARMLMRHGIGGLPVLDDAGDLVGFLSERDIVRALDESGTSATSVAVERVMQRPAPTCPADTTLRDLMGQMTGRRTRHVVITDGRRIAGVVSVGDLVKHRLSQLETEAEVLRDYVAAQRAMS